MASSSSSLNIVRLGIDTQKEHVVYMLRDCHICKSEGFEALTRVNITVNGRSIIASLNIINAGILEHGEAGVSERAWESLNANVGDRISFAHVQPVASMSNVRAKMYGKTLTIDAFRNIMDDIVNGKYSNVEIAAFITACAGDNLTTDEMIALTEAMVDVGQEFSWSNDIVVDKHCVGGLPGNRTTPIVVSIVAAAGLTIPKTSSRAITSPAGTIDTMETMTVVALSMDKMLDVVKKENGCFAWGGSLRLSPADDILIRVERALDIDSEGQMVASVLSKKKAAGSTHVVIDIPIGKTAKVRTQESADKLKCYFTDVGEAIGLHVKVLFTDGSQPVGRGIGPSLEAMDVLSVLRNETNAPQDLRERALLIAGNIIDLASTSRVENGISTAREILSSGKAYNKFLAICQAQGGFKEPVFASNKIDIVATKSGRVIDIDNRRLAKVAKLAGAPHDSSSGVLLSTPLESRVINGDLIFTVYAESVGELNYAMDYLNSQEEIISIE